MILNLNLPDGTTITAAGQIIREFPNNWIERLLALKESGEDISIAEIHANGAKTTTAARIIRKFPDDFKEKLRALKKIGEKITFLSESHCIKEHFPNQFEEINLTLDGAELTAYGVHYLETGQSIKTLLVNNKTTNSIFESGNPVLFKTADAKAYKLSDFKNLDKDITPLVALVQSGLLEQYQFEIKDILIPHTLNKITEEFGRFLNKYQTGNLKKYPEEMLNAIGANLLPIGAPSIFLHGELNPALSKLILGIKSNHQVIRVEISELYDQIENNYKKKLEKDAPTHLTGYLDIETKEKERLKRQFIDFFLIETKDCKLVFGEEKFNQALRIAEDNKFNLSLNLVKKLATAFKDVSKDTAKKITEIDTEREFSTEGIRPCTSSDTVKLVERDIYVLLSRNNYYGLPLLQRLKQDKPTFRSRNRWPLLLDPIRDKQKQVIQKLWLDKLTEALGKDDLHIHQEKLIYTLNNLTDDELKPLLGFSMQSAENLANLIIEHSKENYNLFMQAVSGVDDNQPKSKSKEEPEGSKRPTKKPRLK